MQVLADLDDQVHLLSRRRNGALKVCGQSQGAVASRKKSHSLCAFALSCHTHVILLNAERSGCQQTQGRFGMCFVSMLVCECSALPGVGWRPAIIFFVRNNLSILNPARCRAAACRHFFYFVRNNLLY
jgi:hypothetical protein